MNQLTFQFPFKTTYFQKDFYVSSNNFEAYKLIDSWPNWPDKWINLYGPNGCGKTHLANIFSKKINSIFIDSKNFNIVSHTAMPMAGIAMQQLVNSNLLGTGNSANSIDLTTNANYFKVSNLGALSVSLPFYGETRSASYSGNLGNIKFEGVPLASSFIFNDSKNRYEASYEFKTRSDVYKITIQIYLNSKTRLMVIPGNKSAITYLGVVQGI